MSRSGWRLDAKVAQGTLAAMAAPRLHSEIHVTSIFVTTRSGRGRLEGRQTGVVVMDKGPASSRFGTPGEVYDNPATGVRCTAFHR